MRPGADAEPPVSPQEGPIQLRGLAFRAQRRSHRHRQAIRKETAVWRVAIYAREAPGRAGQARLDRQVASLAAQVVRQPGWCHVATYADQGTGTVRPGLSRMLADAPSYFDLVAVNSYGRLSPDHRELQALLAQLGGAGVRVVVLRPAAGRRFARLVANLALADLVGASAR